MARATSCVAVVTCVLFVGPITTWFLSKCMTQAAGTKIDTLYFVQGSVEDCLREVGNGLLDSERQAFSLALVLLDIHGCVSSSITCDELIQHESPTSEQLNVSYVPSTPACGAITWSAVPQYRLNTLYRSWEFRIPLAWALRFRFTDFEIPHQPKCPFDQVRLYGSNDTELSREPLCGYRRPETFYILNSSLTILLDLWRPGPQTVAHLEATYEWLPRKIIRNVGESFTEVQGWQESSGRLPTAAGPVLETGLGTRTSIYKWRVIGSTHHSVLSFTIAKDLWNKVDVFDGPDDHMPGLPLQEEEDITTSGYIGFVVLTVTENELASQFSTININYTAITDDQSQNRCLRRYSMVDLKESLTLNLLDVTGRHASQNETFRLCQIDVSTVSRQYIMVQFLKNPESVKDIDHNMKSCIFAGLLLEEQDGEEVLRTGPICEQEALVGLDSSVYTSAASSLRLTYFSYGLERFWTLFENIQVRFRLSRCSGIQLSCKGKSGVDVVISRGTCYNLHSSLEQQSGWQAECLITLTSISELNIIGSLQVYVPRTQWTAFYYAVNDEGHTVKRSRPCTETIQVDTQGTGSISVDEGNTKLPLGSKTVSLRHFHGGCGLPPQGAYHFHARPEPCEEHEYSPRSSTFPLMAHSNDVYTRSLNSECGQITTAKSRTVATIVTLFLNYSADHVSHFELTVQKSVNSYSSTDYCSYLCPATSTVIHEAEKRYTFSHLMQPFKWKTKGTKIKISMVVKRCWDHCQVILTYQAVPPSLALDISNSTHNGFCEIHSGQSRGIYLASTAAPSWMKAKELCSNVHDAHLMSLNSKEELRALLLAASTSPECGDLGLIWDEDFVFIGLASLEQDNTFRWSNGDPPAFTEWTNPNYYPQVTPSKAVPGSTSHSKFCTVMTLYTPEEKTAWHKVNCAQKLPSAVSVCERTMDGATQPSPPTAEVVINNDETIRCPYGWNIIGSSCFMLFTPRSSAILMQEEARSYCRARGGKVAELHADNITLVATYLDIWHHQPRHGGVWLDITGNGSIPNNSCTALLPSSEATWVVEAVPCNLPSETHRMHVLCERETRPVLLRCRSSQFQCADGVCIHSEYRCDQQNQCPDGSDEMGCDVFLPGIPPDGSFAKQGDGCGTEHTPLHLECASGECLPVSRVCDGIHDCLDGLDEALCQSTSIAHGRQCSYSSCEQEEVDHSDKRLSILQPPSEKENRSSGFTCQSEHYQSFHVDLDDLGPCTTDFDSACWPRYMSCILDYNVRNKVCDKKITFDNCLIYRCPGYFKCRPKTTSGSYCIPLSRICDGHRDCELGEDEHCRRRSSHPGSFRCPRTERFLSQSRVCDGRPDCRPQDAHFSSDELFCDMTCPPGCSCIGYGIMCPGIGLTAIPVVSPQTKALILPDNKLRIQKHALHDYHLLLKIDFSGNNLTKLDFLSHMSSEDLLELNLSRNALKNIPSRAFSQFEDLVKLDLRKNALTYIAPYAFHNLRRLPALHLQDMNISDLWTLSENMLVDLRFINLSYNRIDYLGVESFQNVEFLEYLDMRGNPLHLIHPDTFKNIFYLRHLNMTEFKFCCAAQETTERCDPQPDEFSSCNDLMANSILRICIWMLGLLGISANLGVMLWRRHDKTPLAFLIQNLGISDFMMGIYMIIIGGADAHYRGKYYLYDEIWRASIACRIAGFISMLSSEMSVYVLVLITLDRLHAVITGSMGLGSKTCKVLLVAGWVVFSVLSALPIAGLSYFGTADYIQNGVCFLFNLTKGKVLGWEYATAIFIGFNLSALCVLVVGYVITFIRVSMQTSGLSGTVEGRMAQRMSLIVLTDCMCWIPPITIGLLSLHGNTIHPQVAVWVAVFVFPINSSLNPFLYTFSTTQCDDDEAIYEEESEEERVNVGSIATAALAGPSGHDGGDISQAVTEGANANAPVLELTVRKENQETDAMKTETGEKEHDGEASRESGRIESMFTTPL